MITEETREKLDSLISYAIAQEVTWDDLFNAFDAKTIESDEMEDILLELKKKNIKIIDTKNSVEDLSTDDYVYIKMNVAKFKDCIPILKKYEGGELFCDYLSGKKITQIANEYSIEKTDAIRKIRQFASYVYCWNLEKEFLGIFLEYKVPREFAIQDLHLDLEVFRFLNARSYVIPIEQYKKYPLLEKYYDFVKELEPKED